ncbi:MAG: AzlC family ABC transporter permease [Pseudomonadota bacterium]|nr:AzlC family ABC transporter permease [Pseudomonadota bacterium]
MQEGVRKYTKSAQYFEGLRYGLPFLLMVMPFSILFGVVATEAGLDLVQTMVMTTLVVAGASQFAAIQQMVDNAPVVMVLATSLAVNMRMAMYSAALVPHFGKAKLWQRALVAYLLVDQSAAVAGEKYEAEPDLPIPLKLAYLMGVLTPIVPMWFLFTLIGALVGSSIPDGFGIDFAVPLTFIALFAPMLKTLAHVAAAATSVILALLFAFIPYGLGLIFAALAAMAAGSLVEVWMSKRAAP